MQGRFFDMKYAGLENWVEYCWLESIEWWDNSGHQYWEGTLLYESWHTVTGVIEG